jgi:hypothetical protein
MKTNVLAAVYGACFHANEISVARARHNAKLTAQQAVEIYRLKDVTSNAKKKTSLLVKHFGVSRKAIRDIWRGRTWGQETQHLDADGKPVVSKPIGRPKGAKDKKPRRGEAYFFFVTFQVLYVCFGSKLCEQCLSRSSPATIRMGLRWFCHMIIFCVGQNHYLKLPPILRNQALPRP